jgi:hypothetical protein
MASYFNSKGRPFILLDDNGEMKMYSAEGSEVSQSMWLRLKAGFDEVPTVLGFFMVNVVKDKDEMMKEIERYNNE